MKFLDNDKLIASTDVCRIMQAAPAQLHQPQNPQYAPQVSQSPSEFSPSVRGGSQKKNRAWIIPSGMHVVVMLSTVVYAFVFSLFDPYGFENESTGTIFWYSLTTTIFFFTIPGFVVSAVSVSLAVNNKCSKILAVSLTTFSFYISLMLLALITSSFHPESFSDGWDTFFSEGEYLQSVVPQLSAHIMICLGVVALMVLGKEK
jgi:hypothetical protein